jgi:hypothetical protein
LKSLLTAVRSLKSFGIQFWVVNFLALGLAFPVNLLYGFQINECNPETLNTFEFRCNPQIDHPYLIGGVLLGTALVLLLALGLEKPIKFDQLFIAGSSFIYLFIPQFFIPEHPHSLPIEAGGYFSPFTGVMISWGLGMAISIGIGLWRER